jgi:hypothetical protein
MRSDNPPAVTLKSGCTRDASLQERVRVEASESQSISDLNMLNAALA